MTPFERIALKAIISAEHDGMRASEVGYQLWLRSSPETRKAHPKAQGLALMAGRFLHSLWNKGLIRPAWDAGWVATRAGFEAAAE